MFVFVEMRSLRVKNAVKSFFSDVLRLLRASPLFGGSLIIASIILGFGPILWWQFFAKFIDYSYSARGVGTVTSDLFHAVIWISILAALMTISTVYLAQTKALSRSIGFTIVFWAIGVTHVIALLPITKSYLIFLAILSIGFSLVRQRIARIAIGVALFLLSTGTVSDILYMMTRRSFSVGSMLEYSGIILTLTLLVAILNIRRLKILLCAL